MKKLISTLVKIAVPIMIQNAITNFVALLDNIMIGQVGNNEMAGVSIVNQLMFVFYLCVFGAISGAGIFGAQFYGQGNHEGVRHSFRFKVVICAVITVLGIAVFAIFGENLAMLYMDKENDIRDIEETLRYSMQYMNIAIIGLIPFAFEQCYIGTLRETNEAVLPMKAGIVAVITNTILNFILIFGHFGAPKLGVQGAAIATVTARVVECMIVVIWTHAHKEKNLFIVGAYRNFRIPAALAKKIIIKGTPLLLNEGLWAAGMAVLTQIYSKRGLPVVSGLSISSTIGNLFNIMFIATGSAIAIIVGQQLGSRRFDEAMDYAKKCVVFTFVSNVIIGTILFVLAPLFPAIYNSGNEVKELATSFIRITAIGMPVQAVLHSTYFIIRSGGKTFITFLFDSAYVWVFSIPLAFVLTKHTALYIVGIYFICQMSDIIKTLIGLVMLRKGIWISDIVTDMK